MLLINTVIMNFRTIALLAIFLSATFSYAQDATQNIRGKVMDEQSRTPIPYANIVLLETNPLIGTSSDENGVFIFENIALGRYNIQISFLGYESVIITEVLVNAAKEAYITISLKEDSDRLEEVFLKPRIHKEKALNIMATVSARMLSVEEASRYAGGFDDPARLASSFAGVSSNISNNAIIIRGNAPKFTQWKMEGVEIPNPNHFANIDAFGGGGLTALSSNLLANSDFFTGAFPAEYNNALSGVFDMRMRSGNKSTYEHSAEVGAIGIDFASEGPLNKNENASYLINYRYSTLGLVSSLLPEDAQGTNYQDIAFKFHFQTEKAGSFAFWGLGLLDESGSLPEEDSSLWEYYQDIEKSEAKQSMGVSGINHRLFFKNNSYMNTTLALSGSGLDFYTDRLDAGGQLQPKNKIVNTNYNMTVNSYLNTKFSKKHVNRTGISLVGMNYDLLLAERVSDTTLKNLVAESGFSSLLSVFSNSTFAVKKLNINAGINAQLFTLNDNYTIEPRVGLSYQIGDNNKISFAYGLHSRLEQLHTYFTGNESNSNKDLDFSRAHHFVLGLDWNIGENTHVKLEPYFQYLFDIPISKQNNFSLINLENDWFVSDKLENEGLGKNYGIDVSVEKYITNGFYYLVSASLFDSKFSTDTYQWFNTRYNKGFVFNAIAGKEYSVGKRKQNLFSINLRLSLQGGERYSPIDYLASDVAQDIIYDESVPFSEKTKNSIVSHVTLNYQINKNGLMHGLSLKVLNANNFKEFLGHRYNFLTNEVEEHREALLIPNLSYKISF